MMPSVWDFPPHQLTSPVLVQICYSGLVALVIQATSGHSGCRQREEAAGKGGAFAENRERGEEPFQVSFTSFVSRDTKYFAFSQLQVCG